LPEGTNIYCSGGGKFEDIGSVKGVERYKIVFFGGSTSYSLVQTLVL